MKQAFHYTAHIKSEKPTRFYHERGPIALSASEAFRKWVNADTMMLWPTHERGVYRAAWFDIYADRFRETTLTILEERAVRK
jgi:hypothetical protein